METYSVEANQFHETVQSYFKQEHHFYDVTLATDDHHQIKAHKLVLSAGSLYFRELLEKADHPQPYIHIGGFSRYELSAVLKLENFT